MPSPKKQEKLQARAKRSGGRDYSWPLVVLFLICAVGSAVWYLRPQAAPMPADERIARRAHQLTREHPEAEVFASDAAESAEKKK